MPQSYAAYKKSLQTYQETLQAISLRRAVRVMAGTKSRLVAMENAQANERKARERSRYAVAQQRLQSQQESIRRTLNNRWA